MHSTSTRSRTVLTLLIFAATPVFCAAQSCSLWESAEPGPYAVGYERRDLFDYSRTFKAETDYFGHPASGETARPIPLHLFFPAAPDVGKDSMCYADFVKAAGFGTSDSNEDSARASAISAYKMSLSEIAVPESVIDSLLSSKTPVLFDAQAAPETFPVIIYAPSINSDPYENLAMLAGLAGHGYLVVSSPSFGQHSAEVARDAAGAETGARDIEFLLSYIRQLPQADIRRVACVGFSWGGMTNIIVATRNHSLDAVVSLDGALFIERYKHIAAQLPTFDINRLRTPLMAIVGASPDRTYGLYDNLRYADAYLVKIAGIPHRAFTSDFILRELVTPDNAPEDMNRLCNAYRVICSYTLRFLDAHVCGDTSAMRILQQDPSASGLPSLDITYTWKKALCRPPLEEEFLEIINTQGAQAAADVFADIRSRDSAAVFFREESIVKFAFEWGPERAEEVIILLSMNVQAYPNSADSFYWLGQAYLAKDDLDNARKSLRKALAINPAHEKALRLLARIGE